MDPAALVGLSPNAIREHLPGFVCASVDADAPTVARLQRSLAQITDAASLAEIAQMQEAFAQAGGAYEIFGADPLARRITRRHLQDLTDGSTVTGVDRLQAIAGRPQIWLCNHLSYTDTQVLDALLSGLGHAVADDLLVVAGPKVYTDAYRRIASIGLNTLKTPQSATVASEGPALTPRELATIALETQSLASNWRDQRGPVLLYAEGSRSPDGRLQPFLRGVRRWVRRPAELVIVPVAHHGAEALFARDERMRPCPVSLAFGAPFTVQEATRGGRQGVLTEAWGRIAGLLPPSRKPAPETLSVT